MTDFLAIARAYEADILSGEIPACFETKAAIERARRDHSRVDEAWPYRFDPARATRACRFISNLRHIKSSIATKAGERIVLLGWQVWMITELYGWVRIDSGNRRWKKAWLQLGKGNGKSTLAGCLALMDAFVMGEGGADVLCAASQREQAHIVLNSARQMLQRDKELCKKVGLEVQTHVIHQRTTQSAMRALPAKASSVEGVQPSMAVLDEVHAARGRELYDTLSTACAKRASGMLLMATTVGNNHSCAGYEMSEIVSQLQNQEVEEDTFFELVNCIDVKVEWDAPTAGRKPNRSCG